MSTRVLRKLKKSDPQIDKLKGLNLNDEEDADELEETQSSYVNKYQFLEDEDNLNEDENKNDDDDDQNKAAISTTKSKNKNKKKKGKKDKTENEGKKETNNNEFKFITDSDNPLFNENIDGQQSTLTNEDEVAGVGVSNQNKIDRSLLQIEAKYLNCEYEMIRMFGAKVVNAEKSQNRKNTSKRTLLTKLTKHNTIVNGKSSWPEFRKNGLQMKLLTDNPNADQLEFTYEHSEEYQRVQFNFLDAVESLDHNNIIFVLQTSPFHIDSIIQLSDVSRIHDDTQTAADLIERALYAFQNTFHPAFSLQKNNFRLDYCRVENRGFFICLFKHVLFTGAKACYRTSLEISKLLLSLDINNDPLGVILLIDFYALRSKQHKYFIEFYNSFNPIKHLNLLPNMQYSIALAYFHLYEETRDNEHLNEANKQLKEALTKFPGLLMQLLDKCGIQPDKEVENSRIFAKHYHLSTPNGLKYLYDLYSIRMNCEWKLNEVIVWLEKNVKEIVQNESSLNKTINDNKSKFKTLFAKIPPNVIRHIILSDLKEVTLTLPREYASKTTYTFDPIPPSNSIVSYKRPDRPRTVAAYANEASLLTFFRSLLPNFNSEERVPEGAAAAGGGREEILNQFGNIAANLREFLANLQPVEHNEEPANNDDNNDDNIEEGHEYD